MAIKRIQDKIAGSRLALPITAVCALAAWFAGGLVERQMYAQLVMLVLSAFLMVELNNKNALIRIYSRMVSCAFIALATMSAFVIVKPDVWFIQLCITGVYIMLFKCYQNKNALSAMFSAYFLLGMASIFFIQVLFFVPFLWIMTGSNLMAFSKRTLPVSLIGLIAPYWFLAGYSAYTGEFSALTEHFVSITHFSPILQYEGQDIRLIIVFFYLTLLTGTGTIHFLRNSYKDKIRTRMLYEIFITMSILIFVMTILQPQHAEYLISIMTISTSALIAHFIALTHTRITNIAFIVMLAVTVALTIFNIWTPLSNF